MRGLDDSKYLFLHVPHQKEDNSLPLTNVFWGPTRVKGLLNILLRPFNFQGEKKELVASGAGKNGKWRRGRMQAKEPDCKIANF